MEKCSLRFFIHTLLLEKTDSCRFKIRQSMIDSYFSFLQEVSVLKISFMGENLLLGFCFVFLVVVCFVVVVVFFEKLSPELLNYCKNF